MLPSLKVFFPALLLFLLFSPQSFSQGFNAVYSKDGSDVIAVGQGGSVFRSWTGGSSWGSYPLGSNNFNTVQSIGIDFWIAGDNGTFYSSSNDGVTWNMQTLAGGQNLRSVCFNDANTGWIVGDNGTILKTTNSGVNWTTQTSPVSVNLNSVKFTTNQTGIACGNNGKVIHTTNGGANWTQLTTTTTKNLLSIDQMSNIIFVGASGGVVFKSSDNGTTWSVLDYGIMTKSDINSVFMLDPNTYYSCGGGGFIRKSTDGGNTFTYQANPMMGNLVSIYFFNSLKGWAVSSLNQAIIYTTDGGATWSLPPGTTVSYTWQLKQSGSGNIGNGFCLHPMNRDGIFIAMGTQVYRSLDKGETWTQIATITVGTQDHTFFVNALDTNIMIASMNSSGGRVMRSTDYGQTWVSTWGPGTLTSYGMPMEVDPNNPNVCYLAPDNSTMLRSTDFGLTWNYWSSNVFRSPCDIAILYGYPNIMYLGDGTTGFGAGELFKSTNGGLNWVSIHTVSGSEIPMLCISSLDPTIAYHTCWSSGGFWRTNNEWNTFTQVNTASGAWGTDISKDDPNVVMFGIYGSTSAYISTNGGNNFFTTSTLPGPNYGVLYYDKGNLLTQESGGVYKMTVSYSVITGNNSISSEIPNTFSISQNFPNPFNPSTTIEYSISKASNIQIKVFDISGREVQSLVNNFLLPGKYSVSFNASNLSSGIYFYTLISDGQKIDTRKMVLLK
jgi:photosystem II stability/assembly factor-like uncharacterized protein